MIGSFCGGEGKGGGGWRGGGKGGEDVPEGAFGSDAQVLEDEPDAHVVVWVGEFEGADAEAANQVSRKHAAGGRAGVMGRSGEAD